MLLILSSDLLLSPELCQLSARFIVILGGGGGGLEKLVALYVNWCYEQLSVQL